jgi:hypothetical protein
VVVAQLIQIYLQVKGLSGEELAARNDLVLALPDRIQAVPDGTAPAPKQTGGWTASASRTQIKFGSGGLFTLFRCEALWIHFWFAISL